MVLINLWQIDSSLEGNKKIMSNYSYTVINLLCLFKHKGILILQTQGL
jgi:hypothetical protein